MINSISPNLIKKNLNQHIIDLLPALGFIKGSRSKHEIRFNRRGSLSICLNGPFCGCWHHFEHGEGGDIFELIMWAMNMNFYEAKCWSFQWLISCGVSGEDLLYE